ncbi:unnamed protein product, partial [Amoebophrya sp. A25]
VTVLLLVKAFSKLVGDYTEAGSGKGGNSQPVAHAFIGATSVKAVIWFTRGGGTEKSVSPYFGYNPVIGAGANLLEGDRTLAPQLNGDLAQLVRQHGGDGE